MKAKPKKSRNLSLVGGAVREIHFNIGGDSIPTVREKSVKSLGRLYSIRLIDIGVQRSREEPWRILNQLTKLIYSKRWRLGVTNMVCYPVFCGPYRCIRMCVERVWQYNNLYLRKWHGVTPCFTKVGLYSNSGNLQLPISSLVEEFKIGKARFYMMMKNSANKVFQKAYPEIKSSTKWSAFNAVQEAECSLRIKNIIGVTQTNRAGLGSTSNIVFSKLSQKEKRNMVIKDVRMSGEEQWTAITVTQAKQCAWTIWNDIEPIKLSWKSLITMEPMAISFLL